MIPSPVSKRRRRRAAGVDQEYFRARQFHHRRGPLADVEMGDAQFLALLALAPPIGAARPESDQRECDQCT